MTLSVTFYDNIKYHRQDFINRDKDFYGNGVVSLSHFPYTLPTPNNMTIQIGAGVAWVDGYRIENDANAISLTAAAADATNPRIDIVQIGHDDFNSQAVLTIKKGVPGSSPVEPDADPNYVKLFAINVAANATVISASNITDKRVLVPLNVQATQINMGGAAGTGQKNTFTDTQTFSKGSAPINIPNQASLPAVGPKDTLVVANNMWYRSDGTQWIAMSSAGPGNASTTQAGIVKLNSATNSTDETTAATPKAVKTVNDALISYEAENDEEITNINVNIIDIAIELETLKGATLNGVTANIFIETFLNLNDVMLDHGVYDTTNKRLVV